MNQSLRHRQIRSRIVAHHLPNAMVRFLEKNEDYGVGSDEFGAKAQIMDIARKYKKIRAAIWDDEELVGEPLEEVIEDMIGHLLLLLEGLHDYAGFEPQPFAAADWQLEYRDAMTRLFDGPADG